MLAIPSSRQTTSSRSPFRSCLGRLSIASEDSSKFKDARNQHLVMLSKQRMEQEPNLPRLTSATADKALPRQWSERELAAAVELNHAESIRLEGCLPWVKLHDDGDALWIFAGDTWPRNTVARARFMPET